MQDDGKLRYQPLDLAPVLPQLLERLFGALYHPDSSENEYLMKCIMRVLSFMGPDIKPVAPVALSKLSEILLRVCENPTQPAFNHYLFEAVAALIRHGEVVIEASSDPLRGPSSQLPSLPPVLA